MKYYLTILLLIILGVCKASPPRDVYTTQQDGDWSISSTWDLGVPTNNQTGNNDDIIINHNITLNGVLDVKSGTTITITAGDTLIVNGDVIFNNGSSITIESGGVLIINGNVTNNNNSTDVNIDGTIVINGNYTGGNGSELVGSGSMDVSGSVTTNGDGTVFGSDVDCVTDCDNSSDDPLTNDPLPIELIWFRGDYINGNVVLNWLVSSEINNDYYEIIEVYEDNTRTTVDTVDGSGNLTTIKQYTYSIESVESGLHYYCLKQVDFDGNYKQYSIISVYVPIDDKDRGIVVWPNPSSLTNDDINVSINGFKGEKILLVLMDVHGNIHYERVVVSLKDNTVIIIESNLSAGTYIIVGSQRNELYRRKLIITE